MNIENLTNFELAHALGMYLNDKYSTGGYSLGRSNRSYLLDLFFRLNQNEGIKAVQRIDPFENQELFLLEISKRLEQIEKNDGQMLFDLAEELDIGDKKIFSAVILRLWIQHYQEEIERNARLDHATEKTSVLRVRSKEHRYYMICICLG